MIKQRGSAFNLISKRNSRSERMLSTKEAQSARVSEQKERIASLPVLDDRLLMAASLTSILDVCILEHSITLQYHLATQGYS